MIKRVDFYLLRQRHSSEKLLFACQLTNRAYKQGMSVYLLTESLEYSQYLDTLLWDFSKESFIPHSIHSQKTDWKQYPVQIGNERHNSEHIDLLISLQSKVPDDYQRSERIADLIINNLDENKDGRKRYRFYRNDGISLKIHKM